MYRLCTFCNIHCIFYKLTRVPIIVNNDSLIQFSILCYNIFYKFHFDHLSRMPSNRRKISIKNKSTGERTIHRSQWRRKIIAQSTTTNTNNFPDGHEIPITIRYGRKRYTRGKSEALSVRRELTSSRSTWPRQARRAV